MGTLRETIPKSVALKQDDSIMGTNNSSIVSKRSVERLYYPDEPHFFRYFVKKPQRRSPLINRGYWLRMKAVETVVLKFLKEPLGKKKMVINLGCGYDPNPWQCLARYPEACNNVKFIDVDYMPLMAKKCDIVRSTSELRSMLTNLSFSEGSHVLLRSDEYLQVGCDLRELSELSRILATAIDLENSAVLCTAEVSLTYMNVDAADDVIKWACKLPDARFCLLEQVIPEGPEYPFAQTMMAHFEKLRTPLQAVNRYPATADQEMRFRNSGWTHVWAVSLWELWGSKEFLNSSERMALDEIEPFDEWEEFVLFACHYFLLVASNGMEPPSPRPVHRQRERVDRLPSLPRNAWAIVNENQKSTFCRRFGASLSIRGQDRRYDLIANFAGMGRKARLNSLDVYTPTSIPDQLFHKFPPSGAPSPRMCHTITDIGGSASLLVGGRTSPDSAMSDCWIYYKWTNTWERVDDLPEPRYRHSAVAIGGDSILLAGGKSDSRTILADFCIWNQRHGWVKCVTDWRISPQPQLQDLGEHQNKKKDTFGGVFATTESNNSTGCECRGVLAGGMTQDGLISKDLWYWTLKDSNGHKPSITLEKSVSEPPIARFGANVVNYAGQVVVVGGVMSDMLLKADEEILIFEDIGSIDTSEGPLVKSALWGSQSSRPLFVGCSIYNSGENIVITGGGAVCFSFGTFWNSGCFSLCPEPATTNGCLGNFQESKIGPPTDICSEKWRYLRTVEVAELVHPGYSTRRASEGADETHLAMISIPRKRVTSSTDFSTIVAAAKPVVLEGLDLGCCTEKWTSIYLQSCVGYDHKVTIHHASTSHMDFVSKNFQYVTKSFGEFIQAVDAGDKLYLRSLSAENPSEVSADLHRDFPTIAGDFQLPPELGLVTENMHSSALRISGPVNMWLHYDVMANVLCQIRGGKRLLLFPPSDVSYFNISPGSSSSSEDVFSIPRDRRLAQTHPHEALLSPGDVLFLPALWLHSASPTDGMSVAVNVFFRNLDCGYAAGKDIYGNRDLQAYEKGRQDVARIAKSFGRLPDEARNFYLQRLADELRNEAGGRRV